MTGTVFWKGQNKTGPATATGSAAMMDSSGSTAAASRPPRPTSATGHTFDKGDRVPFVPGGEGTGTVFWVGQSRARPGAAWRPRRPPRRGGRLDLIDGLAARPLDPGEDPARRSPLPRGRSNPYQGATAGARAAASGGGWSGGEGADEMPSDYAAPMGMDEMPSAPPMDDASLDQLGEWVPEDQEPPADW